MTYRRTHHHDRCGAVLPLIAVAIVLLFVVAVFSVDIARIHVTRSELRTATDAAARAAVEALGRTESEVEAIDAAMRVAHANTVAGKPLLLDPTKIEFGHAIQQLDGSFTYTGGTVGNQIPNAVRIIGERTDSSPDGPVNMLFGGMFGQSTFQPIQSATATRLDRDIAMVVDKSGSMADNNRFEALKNGLMVFATELENSIPVERVSLTAYDTTPIKLIDMTEDLSSMKTRLDTEIPDGRTGIGLAMEVGIDSVFNDPMSRSMAMKSIVVMTDGNHNEGVSPLTVAYTAKSMGITVHTITFSDGANQDLMREVATITGGRHLHAVDNQQLIEAFAIMARQLQVLLIE